jgi:predicted aminopeptidase
MKLSAFVLLFLALVCSISGCYLLKQGSYLLSYNARARSIEKLLSRGSLETDVQTMLRTVQEVRRYATEEIGLEGSRNYTRYLELDRDYVVDVVTASARDSFTPHLWRFPLLGALPYKGYYQRRDAEREASRLEQKGWDVWIGEVDGFSTLGFFSDPVYSFMTDYSAFELADLIIHEQTHATVFFKNQTQFNEEMATFVGREGALAFLRDFYGTNSAIYREALSSLADWNVYRDQVMDLYDQLQRLYESQTDRELILSEKKRIVEQFNRRLDSEAAALFQTERFRSLRDIPANNAYIQSFARYSRNLDQFYRLYEINGRDLRTTVAILKGLQRSNGSPEQNLKQRRLQYRNSRSPNTRVPEYHHFT